jgi:hypothetical protein
MPPPSEASPYASRNHLLSSQRAGAGAHGDQPAAQPTPPVLPPIRMAAAEASELQQQQQISGNRRSPAASYTEAISQCSSSGRSDPPPIPCPEAPDAKSAVGNRTDWAGRVLGPARGVGLLGDAGIRGRSGARGGWSRWRRSGEFGGGGGKSQFPLRSLSLSLFLPFLVSVVGLPPLSVSGFFPRFRFESVYIYMCGLINLDVNQFINYFYGTASARTSDPGASHRTGSQPSDLKMFNRQPLDLKSAE